MKDYPRKYRLGYIGTLQVPVVYALTSYEDYTALERLINYKREDWGILDGRSKLCRVKLYALGRDEWVYRGVKG